MRGETRLARCVRQEIARTAARRWGFQKYKRFYGIFRMTGIFPSQSLQRSSRLLCIHFRVSRWVSSSSLLSAWPHDHGFHASHHSFSASQLSKKMTILAPVQRRYRLHIIPTPAIGPTVLHAQQNICREIFPRESSS